MSHVEIQELLAPFALDAVDDPESETVELHVRDCPACEQTVRDFRESVSHLAAGYEPVPARVWDAIAERLDTAADRPTVVPFAPNPERPARRWRVLAIAAAVAAIAGLGVQVVSQQDRVDELQAALEDGTVLSAALAAEAHPNARRAELRNPDGVFVGHAVLTPDGTGFLRSEALARVSDDRTYQLWAVIGTERISAGVLGPEPGVVPFRAAGDVIALAITEEAAGGVVASENQPVAVGVVS